MKTKLKIGDCCGRWTIIGDVLPSEDGRKRFVCRCECGAVREVRSDQLVSGQSLSCGCLRINKVSTHGKTNTRLYNIWHKMKERCYNQNHNHFYNYGGRGITVCDEWKDNFQSFYDWAMLHGYSNDLSIDRIDNNKGYSPENCRWSTNLVQQNNTRLNRFLTLNGDTKSVAQWAKSLNIPYSTIYSRLNKGWSVEDVLCRPVDERRSTKRRSA